MIYRSNLKAPDLQPYFKHTQCRPMPHSCGHDVLTDFADKADDDPVFGPYKNCGFWTHDEAAILYNIALKVGGHWADIGGLTGWTAAHLAAAGCFRVESVDPMYNNSEFHQRTRDNLRLFPSVVTIPTISRTYFAWPVMHEGVVIDGDHDGDAPTEDAANASLVASVVVFHDLMLLPPAAAFEWLQAQGWRSKRYWTPHGVGVCWRPDFGFTPPEHTPDPALVPKE